MSLEYLVNKRVSITFPPHEFITTVLEITKTRLQDIKGLVPDKRDRDGKMRTPNMFSIITEDGKLVFVQEDTEIIQREHGVELVIGACHVHICERPETMA